ncbi:MAG: Peptide transporter ATP-binding protein, partial [Ilumatobacteraceae bacterium]|nr:Peptide transporter ATP-binding protein [Ilumatobacteraceae bacterium]
MAGEPLLEVTDLSVDFPTDDGVVHAVDKVSYTIHEGETLGIVGESGSGKSVTSLAILGLLPKRARVTGSVKFRGRELVGLKDKEMRPLRGARIAMIFQDALTALNPVFKVGDQIAENITAHHKVPKPELERRVIELLELVGIPNPVQRANQYPHEFSGGMRQRAMIAMSLINDPDLLIADEPTTALDVTVQAQILDLLEDLQKEFNSAIILITHDLGVVAQVADDVLVMYGGRAVEYGTTEQVLRAAQMPYTWGLLSSIP